MPRIRELPSKSSEPPTLLNAEKCKLFPDKVLFYIFYNMPQDRA